MSGHLAMENDKKDNHNNSDPSLLGTYMGQAKSI
jgi:hypothetical protein